MHTRGGKNIQPLHLSIFLKHKTTIQVKKNDIFVAFGQNYNQSELRGRFITDATQVRILTLGDIPGVALVPFPQSTSSRHRGLGNRKTFCSEGLGVTK